MSGRCEICQQDVPTYDLVGHIRVMHPDEYEPPATWPDGSPVILDYSDTVEQAFSDLDGEGQ